MTTTDLDSPEDDSEVRVSRTASPTRRLDRWTLGFLGLLAYVPFLLSSPGEISADTKAYLLLDPGKLLARAPFLWDSHINAGTVTHQNIGYLFPLGPWYWIFRTLGVPTWIAERLWFGTLLFAAGAGTLWMLRKLGLRGPGSAVAAFVYMLSPYMLSYMGRMSVILTPWCALPWLIGLMICALRERTWRAPVLFALIVTVMAGTNASSVIFVLLGPLLLVPFALWATHETDLRSALRSLARIAIATGPAQLWWVSGLYVQGKFGLPILQLTETVETVAETSTASEALRGLGYWCFYGKDGLTGWIGSAPLYTTSLVMLPLSFTLPLLGLLGAILTRWKYRAYFVGLVIVGLVFAVGTYPYRDPSPIGAIIKFTTSLEIGFALRSSPRIIPLVVIGFAALIASFIDSLIPALLRKFRSPLNRRLAAALPLGIICLAILNLPPLWTGNLVQPDLKFPGTLPSYWTDAATWLDEQSNDLRVLELPGADFAAYRWGDTQDPLTPGIITRPWIGREITAYGTPASVDLVRALDRTFQEGVGEPGAVAGVAQLLSASDVLLRLDSQYERYRGPRPTDLWAQFGGSNPSNGLGTPTEFGDPSVNVADPRQPMIDEQHLATTPSRATPPLVAYPVSDVRALLRAEPTSSPTVLFGDADGVVAAATWNQLPASRALFYSPTATSSPALLKGIRASQPNLVITDTNRKRAQRWGTLRENNGATETADSNRLEKDPKDTRLELFPGETPEDQTVAWFGDDVADVQATSYGNIVAYSTEVRPSNSIDGDPRTAWTTGGFSDVVGDKLAINYSHPVTADHIDLLQTEGNRWITKATILLDGEPVTTVDMTDASFVGTGQRVSLKQDRTFSALSIRIDDANITGLSSWVGFSNVGFREVTVPGVSAQEWIVAPRAGIDDLAPSSKNVTYLFSRLRSNPIEGFRQDTELQIRRIFRVGNSSQFQFQGRARLSAGLEGSAVDSLLGRPGLESGRPIVTGTDYLYGDLSSRPSSALDGNLSTAWTTKFDSQVGATATVIAPSPMIVDHLNLSFINDAEHSVPTALSLTLDDGSVHAVAVPAVETVDKIGNVVSVDVPTSELRSKTIAITVAAERAVTSPEFFAGTPRILPISIAEFGLPTQVAPLPTLLPDTCRTGLVTIDGTTLPVALTGTTAAAVTRQPVDLVPCASNSAPLNLSLGDHRITSSAGLDTGIDVDAIQLTSVPNAQDSPATSLPATAVRSTGTNTFTVDISDASEPFWLVLGQSLSDGWKATVRGGSSLGSPTLIDGYANGWLIDPAVTGSTFTVDITWAPQKVVWAGIAVSTFWFLGLCAAALVVLWRRRRAVRILPSDTEPRLISSELPNETSIAVRIELLIGIVVLSAFVGGTGVAIAMAIITALSLWTKRRTAIAVLAVLGSVGGIVVLYTGLQFRRAYTTTAEWPSGFWFAHQLGLVAVLAVVAESVTRWILRVRYNRPQTASDDNPISDGSALPR
ncbi:MAG: alpha-(1-_3)-arabinofuranosyltransferase family protein [Actinomycetes bacterium]